MMATASRISAASSTVLVCCLISSSIFVVPVATAALNEAQKEDITFLHGDALKKREDGLAAQPMTQEDQHVTSNAFLSQASDGTSALSTAKIGAGLSLFLFCICCACFIGIPVAVLYFVYNSFPGNNEQQLAVQPSQGFPQPVVSQRTDEVEMTMDRLPVVTGAAHGPTGWWADAMCDGTRAADRAEWLQANEGLSMWAAQQRVMNEFPQVFTVGGGASGADAPGWRGDVMCDGHTAADRAHFLQTNNGMSAIDAQLKIMAEFPQIFGACIKCKGNGFVHESNMEHKEAPNTKCFFCKECPSCKGTGRAQGPPCIPCKGRGWKHSSGMEHKGAEDAKCFFCDTCQVCQGKGHN